MADGGRTEPGNTWQDNEFSDEEWDYEENPSVCQASGTGGADTTSSVTSGVSRSRIADSNAAGVVYGHVGDVHNHYYVNQCQGCLQHHQDDDQDDNQDDDHDDQDDYQDNNQDDDQDDYQDDDGDPGADHQPSEQLLSGEEEPDSSEPMDNLVTVLNPLSIGECQQQMEETTEIEGNGTQTNETQVSESAEMGPVSVEDVTDTVSISDSNGQKMLPGDGIRFESGFREQFGIYTGNHDVVSCQWGSQMVKKMKLKLTDTFWKMSVRSGECLVYPPEERVDRATAKIGQIHKGDWLSGLDFLHWVFTGQGCGESENKGFRVDW